MKYTKDDENAKKYEEILRNYFDKHYIRENHSYVLSKDIMDNLPVVISWKAFTKYLRDTGYINYRVYIDDKQQRAWIGFRLKNDSERI